MEQIKKLFTRHSMHITLAIGVVLIVSSLINLTSIGLKPTATPAVLQKDGEGVLATMMSDGKSMPVSHNYLHLFGSLETPVESEVYITSKGEVYDAHPTLVQGLKLAAGIALVAPSVFANRGIKEMFSGADAAFFF